MICLSNVFRNTSTTSSTTTAHAKTIISRLSRISIPVSNMNCPNGVKKTDSTMYRLKVMEMTTDMSQSSGITGTDLYDGAI